MFPCLWQLVWPGLDGSADELQLGRGPCNLSLHHGNIFGNPWKTPREIYGHIDVTYLHSKVMLYRGVRREGAKGLGQIRCIRYARYGAYGTLGGTHGRAWYMAGGTLKRALGTLQGYPGTRQG